MTDPQTIAELSALTELQSHDGYAVLVADWQQRRQQAETALHTTDPRDAVAIGQAQAQIEAYTAVLQALPTAIQARLDALNDEGGA